MKRCRHWWIIAIFAALFAGAVFAADGAQISYSKTFPGSVPAYAAITLDETGAGTYKEAVDEDPEEFQLEKASTEAIFALAGKLDHFKRKLESGMKVANTGIKRYRWTEGGNATEVAYNHTSDEDAKALQEWFEKITDSERLLIDLGRTIRFDKLGVHEVLVRMESAWDNKRLVAVKQFLPLVDKVAKNDTYLHMAQERAARLSEEFRAASE